MPKCTECIYEGKYFELATPYPIEQTIGVKFGMPGANVSLVGFKAEAKKYGFRKSDLAKKAMKCQTPNGGPTQDPIVLIQAIQDQPCPYYAPKERISQMP